MTTWTSSPTFSNNAEIAAVHQAAIRSIQRVVHETARPHNPKLAKDGIESMLRAGKTLVLTGAGVSTESGIPDYRGPAGSLRDHRPMTYQEFRYDDTARHRYWARSYVGWRRMRLARPNRAHYALAELEQYGAVAGVITQNVDGLHVAAGSQNVLALHGDLSSIVCLSCGYREGRQSLDSRLDAVNPGYLERLEGANLRVNPDGDVDLEQQFIADFNMVGCTVCDSVKLKPDVVYFGESVPAERKKRLRTMMDNSTSLLIVGSSVAVMSSYKIVLDTLKSNKSVGVMNWGPGRADAKVTYLWRTGVGQGLEEMLDRLGI